MGTSWNIGKQEIYKWVNEDINQINSILDIGAGSGTYYNLLHSLKQFEWSAVEAWKPYIDEFKLTEKYHTIYNNDVRIFNWNNKFFDLTIAGDILEHMTKEDAITLVENILNHSDQLIISIPIMYLPQEEINGNPFEVHIKPDWTHEEVIDTWGNYIKDYQILYMKNKAYKLGIYRLRKE
jgi:cyclopropane fatty-acyl-phospholipid synthase-like methyltransferase